jgi:hypothetical protein
MKQIIFLCCALFLVSCGGSYNIKGSANGREYRPQVAYVENTDGKSADMDAHLQRALMSKGLKISANATEPTDLVVKYTDKWQWDLAMYLNAVHITFYDKIGNIIAVGSYENSFWHEWPNAGETVQKVIDGMFAELGTDKTVSTKKP